MRKNTAVLCLSMGLGLANWAQAQDQSGREMVARVQDRTIYNCEAGTFGSSVLVKEINATIQGVAPAGFPTDTWIYLDTAEGEKSFNTHVDGGATENKTFTLPTSVAATGYRVCSWWNSTRFVDVKFIGSQRVLEDNTKRWMNAACQEVSLATPILAMDIKARLSASQVPAGYSTDSWIYIQGESAEKALHVNLNGSQELDRIVSYDKPVLVRAYSVCSWWNPAELLSISFYGRAEKQAYSSQAGADKPIYDCQDVNFDKPLITTQINATLKSGLSSDFNGYFSDSWIYPQGDDVQGDIHLVLGAAESKSGQVTFIKPSLLKGYKFCSWWNTASLQSIQVLGF